MSYCQCDCLSSSCYSEAVSLRCWHCCRAYSCLKSCRQPVSLHIGIYWLCFSTFSILKSWPCRICRPHLHQRASSSLQFLSFLVLIITWRTESFRGQQHRQHLSWSFCVIKAVRNQCALLPREHLGLYHYLRRRGCPSTLVKGRHHYQSRVWLPT